MVQTVQISCSSWTRSLTLPVIVHVFVVLKTVEIPQLQYLDKVVDVFALFLGRILRRVGVTFAWCLALCMLTVSVRGLSCRVTLRLRTFLLCSWHCRCPWRFPQVQFVLVVTCPLLSDRAWGPDVQKTVFPQLLFLTRWPMSLLVQFIDSVDVPVIMQRRVVSSTVEVPQIHFTARVVDIPVVQQRRVRCYPAWLVMAAMKGFFDAFCVLFRAPPAVPESSASFRSPRAPTPVSARGLLHNFMLRVCGYTHSV